MSKYPLLDRSKPFSPENLQKHIQSFFWPLVEHMTAEIETLKPDNMRYGEDADIRLRDKMQAHFKGYDPTWFLTSVFGEIPE